MFYVHYNSSVVKRHCVVYRTQEQFIKFHSEVRVAACASLKLKPRLSVTLPRCGRVARLPVRAVSGASARFHKHNFALLFVRAAARGVERCRRPAAAGDAP
jgi:hypothetical protein